MRRNDVIVAISTPIARSAIGVVRLSGNNLESIISLLFKKSINNRVATLANVYDADCEIIDSGIAVYYKSPNSYNGEDILEFAAHGNPIILNKIIERCVELGSRPANPGEFSFRALLNGKLDLIQAQAVSDLINIDDLEGIKLAQKSLSGLLSGHINKIYEDLINTRSLIELDIDFSEDNEIQLDIGIVKTEINKIKDTLVDILFKSRSFQSYNDTGKVVLFGSPNVGKSSILNAVLGTDRSIVSSSAGTTRDFIVENIEISGHKCSIVDTAGYRNCSEDSVEYIGINKAIEQLRVSKIVLFVIDANTEKENIIELASILKSKSVIQSNLPVEVGSNESLIAICDKCLLWPNNRFRDEIIQLSGSISLFIVVNKIDCIDNLNCQQDNSSVIWLSAKTGQGIKFLIDSISSVLKIKDSGSLFLLQARVMDSISRAIEYLSRALLIESMELISQQLYLCQQELSIILGKVVTEDLLDQIFSKFCIGK